MKIVTSAIILGSVVINSIIVAELKPIFAKDGYQAGYTEASKYYKDMLLEEGYAEFDKKTAEWYLLDPSTIQGNFILPSKKAMYVNIEDQISSLEDELSMLKKQKETSSKKKSHAKATKLDMKKLF